MIVFDTVTKTFVPDDSGVHELSFSIDPGELVLLTGHSGSGKTTIMRLLTQEYTPNSGTILFDGTDISNIRSSKLHEHRRKIGVVFQDYRLIPEMNIWENIALPLSIVGKPQTEIEERVTDLLNLVQLTQKAHLFPSQLSGGEAQRISIARALAIAPSVLFADEPTGNLDQDTSLHIAELLKKINELGTTLIFATHDPKILSLLADKRHIHLESGSIVSDSGAPTKKPVSKAKTKLQPTTEATEQPKPSKQKDTATTVGKKPSFFARLFGKKTSSSEIEKKTPPEKNTTETKSTPSDSKNKVAKPSKTTKKEKEEVTSLEDL